MSITPELTPDSNERKAIRRTDAHLILVHPLNSVSWHFSELPVRTDPEFRVDLFFWYDLAPQKTAHKKVVIHRLGDDLCNGRRRELDECIVL